MDVAAAVVVALGVAPGVISAAPTPAAEPPDPSVRLFDTGKREILLHPQQVVARKGWAQVPEGRLDHPFAGDAALINDKMAIVVERIGQGLECFTLGDGARWRVTVQPHPYPTGEYRLKVLENSAAAVEVEAADENADNPAATFRLRLTAGEAVAEMRPAPGMEKVTLLWAPKDVVVPDFFGDDMVFTSEAARLRPIAVPAENVLVALDAAGMLVCVWEAGDRGADLYPSPDVATLNGGDPVCIIPCRGGKRMWLALLDGPGLRRYLTVAEGQAPAAALRGFRPPFAAKWRADFVGPGGACESVTFEEPPDAAPVPETWRGPVLIYPIDRSRATPLTAILPIDVLRSTLGVGPCQYILALEGLGSDDAPPTPAAVTEWVEKQFARKRDAKSAEEIGQRLDAMLAHLAAARARIDEYAAFGGRLRAACEPAAGEEATAETAKTVLAICDRLDRDLARGRAAMKTPGEAAGLVRQIVALIGQDGGAAAVGPPAAALRDIGHAQDQTLARLRMAARRAEAACRHAEDGLAAKVRAMAEGMLRRK